MSGRSRIPSLSARRADLRGAGPAQGQRAARGEAPFAGAHHQRLEAQAIAIEHRGERALLERDTVGRQLENRRFPGERAMDDRLLQRAGGAQGGAEASIYACPVVQKRARQRAQLGEFDFALDRELRRQLPDP